MLALEVLQSCPAQRKALLSIIDDVDPTSKNVLGFDLELHVQRLPPQLAFQIQVVVATKTIFRTIIDEGASTCIMSISCWKDIGSPPLTESPNTLKDFDGRVFNPLGILKSLPISLEGKLVEVEMEVVDAPLDFNILLGRSWIYNMSTVVSSLFRVIKFPSQGKISTVDQLELFNADARVGNVSFVGKTPMNCENIGVGLFKDSLLGAFTNPPPQDILNTGRINMISTVIPEGQHDPWIIPDPVDYERYGDSMPPNEIEIAYQTIQSISMIADEEEDPFDDSLHDIFPSDEGIMETMALGDPLWDYSHHHSSLASSSREPGLDEPHSPLEIFLEGNLGVISPTIPIDISIKHGVVEHIHVGASYSKEEIRTLMSLFKEYRDVFAWSYEEMSGINPSIVIHEIQTYPYAKPIRQKLCPVHPRKDVAIKAEVEKLLKAGFIYPVPLIDWVSNIVPVTKKKGTIRVCVDYKDINKACPKDNYPTPFIDQIIDDCAGIEVFSFMDGFSGYNQINILPADQHKTAFIFPWGTFSYRKLPFGLKNVGATFQRVIFE